jgi:RHS repeat-associated protein
MKRTIFLTGILSLVASVSFADWRLNEGCELISTNLSPYEETLAGEDSGKSGVQLYAMESSGTTVTTNETTITPEIRALAETLGNDPLKILDYVRDNIEYVPRIGVYLDAQGCLLAGRGSDWDQAVLMTSLLRASGYTTRYIKALVSYDNAELSRQFDVNNFAAWNHMRWSRSLMAYSLSDTNRCGFPRVWVECWVGGAWRAFDPAFKTYDSCAPADIKGAMQYNFSAFTNSALSGASFSADYVKNLNEGNIRNALNTYRTNLIAYLKTNAAYSATYKAVGIRTVVPQISAYYPGNYPPFARAVFSTDLERWDQLPDSCHAKVKVQHKGIDISLKAWQVAGRRLSILYDSSNGNRPFLSLDGSEIGRGTSTAAGSTNDLTLSVLQPVFTNINSSSIITATNSAAMKLVSGSTCVLIHDFETTSEKVQTAHRKQFVQDRQVKPVGSEAVTAGALQLVADSYLNQYDRYQQLVGTVMNCVEDDVYFFGILASTTNGYFIDLPGCMATISSKTNNLRDENSVFSLGTFAASSLEHGVLEQNQGSENPAVSTIKLLQLCNAGNKKIFYVHSNNWSSVQGQLLNYSAANKAAISNEIRGGAVGYIPEDAHITLSNWTGIGYAMESTNAVSMMIDGGYNGGYNALGDSFSIPAVEENQGHSTANNYVANVDYTFSGEPVNLFTGDYVMDHTDLTLGGLVPKGLQFARYYNSANRFVQGVLGNGWQHNLEIRAFEVSQGAEALGNARAVDVASALMQLTVAKDLMTNAYDSVKRPINILVTKWGMDQLTDRNVVLQFGTRNLTYTKLEDGSYMPQPGETSELRKENDRFVLKERFGTTYTFSTNGFLETWRDADSNTLSFAYSNGRLQSATDAFGRSLSLTYNASNLLYTVSDSTSRQISFAYDTKGNLTNYTDAAGLSWAYEYNTNNLLTAARDPDGVVTIRNFYNSLGCVTQQVSATSNIWLFSIGGNQAVEKDPYGNQTVHWFDDAGRNLGTRNALGSRNYINYDVEGMVTNEVDRNHNTNIYVRDSNLNLTHSLEAFFSDAPRETFFGYDELNHLTAVTNALGNATHNQYDAEHHLTSTIDVLGNETTFEYWPNGLLKKQTEAGGRITDYSYDSYGNVDTVASTDAGTVDFDYNARGELVKKKDAKGAEAFFTYDNRGLLLKTIYPDGSSVSNSYWNNGLLKAATDGRGHSVTNTWTAAYKPLTIRYPDGGTVSNTYDAADRLIATKNAKNQTATYALDAIGRVTSVSSAYSVVENSYDVSGNVTNSAVDPSGLNLWTRSAYDVFNRPLNQQSSIANRQFQYDALGRQTNTIDAASKNWGFEYDELGRKTKNFRPTGVTEQFVYDALGNRIGFYNAEGKPITFRFDAQGRVTAVTNAIGKGTSFAYDNNGNLVDREDAKAQSTGYEYDSMNRLTNVVNQGLSRAAFSYDANGNRTGVRNQESEVSFGYDAMNRLTNSVLHVSGFTSPVSSSYDLNGNRTNIVYPGGLSVGYSYDAENRLSGVAVSAPSEPLRAFSFAYDGASRLTNIVYPNTVNSTFGYDAESRMTNYTHGSFISRSIIRDPRGFKTHENIAAGLAPVLVESEQRMENNSADQVLLITQRDTWLGGELNQWYNRIYDYDDNGSLTQETVSRDSWNTNSAIDEYRNDYTWDYDNRLTGTEKTVLIGSNVTIIAGITDRTWTDGPSTSTEYIYDASGARIGRVHNSVTNYFVVDYSDPLKRPLCETDSSGTVTRYYVWAGFRLLAHISVDGGGDPVVRYYHSDELGSTLALTDEAGTVTDQFAYTPYGKCTARTGTMQTRFQWLGGYGVYYDADTDLHLTLHRAYSADMRRWLSTDPMGIDGGVNLYAYGALNPLAFVDPYGLCADGGDPWYAQAAAWLSRNAPHSVALVGGGTAEAGWGSGGGGQAASGVGLFTGTGIGAFTESGGFASSEPDASTRQFVFGATAGVGAGPFISNASNPQQLLGPFDTMTLNLPLVSIQVAGDGKIWTATVSVGRSYGLSISRYSVTTTTATGSK